VAATIPIRLRLTRAAGFDLQAESRAANGLPAINIACSIRWYNPWRAEPVLGGWRCLGPEGEKIRGLDEAGARQMAFARHRAWIMGQPDHSKLHLRAELRGHNLACWCPLPEPGQPDCCHAATLLELANTPEPVALTDEDLWWFGCDECGWGCYAETEPDECPVCGSPDFSRHAPNKHDPRAST
jgi:hypothetical protein